MLKTQSRIENIMAIIGAILFVVFVFLLICNRAMLIQDNHDEQLFMDSGYLLATKGLLPYRDYAYFHTPNLVFVYALIDKLTVFRLLYTRIFSTVFGTLTIAVIFASTYFFFQGKEFSGAVWHRLACRIISTCQPIVCQDKRTGLES
jgi:hypothetical protein